MKIVWNVDCGSDAHANACPHQWARYPLFGREFEQKDHPLDFSANGPEKLVVLLSGLPAAGLPFFPTSGPVTRRYRASPSDLVIPIREDDLQAYVDNAGRDDPDFRMIAGRSRRYQRSGRWASWSISAVFPELLFWATAGLDKSPVKPND
jgi:hypothetical protein